MLKVFSNNDVIHQFEEKILPITNKKFKDLEIVKELEENLNLNPTKKFENMEICQIEKDFPVIDIKNINYIISDTISENFIYENIQEKLFSKIEVKHIGDLKYNSINKQKRFSKLEILKETEKFCIEANKNIKETLFEIEENKEDNNFNKNTNNNIENGLLLNNMELNDKESSNQSLFNNIIGNNNIEQKQNELLINKKENEINNNNNNIQSDLEESRGNSDIRKKSASNESEELNDNEQELFNHIYLKDIKTNLIKTNPRNNYSQINNQYDSDSRNINNISNEEKFNDKSSITPIKNDSENYSKLIEGIERGEFNIYSNKNNATNNKNESPIKGNESSSAKKNNDKNYFTFNQNKTNNSNKIENGTNKSKHKTNTLSIHNRKNSTKNSNNKINNQKNINKRNSDNIINKMKKESNVNNKNNYGINSINSNKNIMKKTNFSNPNNNKEKDKNNEQTFSEKNGMLQKKFSNVPNSYFPKLENDLNKIVYNSTNKINNKKIKISSEGMNNNKNKNNEENSSSLYINSKNSFFKDSRKTTQKQE